MGKSEKIQGVPKSGKLRKFGLVSYLSVVEVEQALHHNIEKVVRYAYAVHDNEAEESDNHIHILLYTYHPNTYNAIRNWFPKRQNTFAKPILDDVSAYDYLTHSNEPDKVQYSDSIIVKYNFDIEEICYDDNGYAPLQALLDKVPLKTIAKRFGKDFIYHYRAYKDLAEDIEYEECCKSLEVDFVPIQEKLPF